MEKYIGFNIYECPKNPNEKGKYIGKTPIFEQAEKVCENAKAEGKSYFIKGVTPDGQEVLLL